MFKAINTLKGAPVIILDDEWEDDAALDNLRSLGTDGHLVCQGCQMRVRVRAGQYRRRHFAHWHLADCPLTNESEGLLLARAALYKRLRRQFGDQVTIEYQPDDSAVLLPRPIDCWITADGNRGAIGYWIFDRQMRKQDERDALRAALRSIGAAHTQFLFVGEVRRGPDGATDQNTLALSTTERDCLAKSPYDVSLEGRYLAQHQSLQYIEHDKEALITYRALARKHGEQIYQARSRSETPLGEVPIDACTGELFHPGDAERAAKVRAVSAEAEKERARREAEMQAALERVREEAQPKSAFTYHGGAPFHPRPGNTGDNSRPAPRQDRAAQKIGRMIDPAEIAEYKRHRTPRELMSFGNYVKTILTDDEAIAVCGAIQDDPYLRQLWEQTANTGLSKISDTGLVIAHRRAMAKVNEVGIEIALIESMPLLEIK